MQVFLSNGQELLRVFPHYFHNFNFCICLDFPLLGSCSRGLERV